MSGLCLCVPEAIGSFAFNSEWEQDLNPPQTERDG